MKSLPLMDADELCTFGAVELTSRFATGELSPVEATRVVLARAELVNARWNAFTRIDHESALAAARASEQRWRDGKILSAIDGVPTTIKDIVWVKHWSISYGSKVAGGSAPVVDSPAVERLRDAGVVILGLTTTPEFGWKAVTDSPSSGITRNPWNAELTPGGSSGGAAVAAAAGAGVLHLGSDGGGSIRIPAAFSGCVGMKPTFGRVPLFPASAFGTLAHLGPITRRVEDASMMLSAMAGCDSRDWFQRAGTLEPLAHRRVELNALRIGYWRNPPCGVLDPEISAAVDATMRALEATGAVIEVVDLPAADVLSIFETLWFAGAAARLAPFNEEQRAMMDPGLIDVVTSAEPWTALKYLQATNQRTTFGTQMDRLLERHDVLISPAAAVLPFTAGCEVPPGSGLRRWTQWAGFTLPINLSQQPAMVVPCARSSAGLPIALQIVGARGADSSVLAVARAFETFRSEVFL